MISYLLGATGAALGLAATIITLRSNRRNRQAEARRTEQETGQIEDARVQRLREQLDQEYVKRRELEEVLLGERKARRAELAARDETIRAHENRIRRLEEQVRSLGGTPVKEGTPP